jgi:transposase InsO family protein
MPWKETQKMDQRKEFVLRAVNSSNFRELCRQYGISAKTGYKWRDRFIAQGMAGLLERSRRPRGHADRLTEEVICEIVRLKHRHPRWGPRKIQAVYGRQHPGPIPSESSFKRILGRAGLTEQRKFKRAAQTGRLCCGFEAKEPNDIWTVDFKGWWKSCRGLRIEPLTIRDQYSRMILDLRVLVDARTESVRECFERLFERYGLPRAIRSDNGVPFAATNALLGLTRLSAWWLALGIDLDRSRPGCPQDNGGHERMHLDVCDLEIRREDDQAAFDVWREEFNTERPHEALGMRVPAEVYRRSDRSYSGTPDDIDYSCLPTRRVHKRRGTIKHRRELVFISVALGGWSVALNPGSDGLLEVWFSKLLLGHLDPRTTSFRAINWNLNR